MPELEHLELRLAVQLAPRTKQVVTFNVQTFGVDATNLKSAAFGCGLFYDGEINVDVNSLQNLRKLCIGGACTNDMLDVFPLLPLLEDLELSMPMVKFPEDRAAPHALNRLFSIPNIRKLKVRC